MNQSQVSQGRVKSRVESQVFRQEITRIYKSLLASNFSSSYSQMSINFRVVIASQGTC